MTDNQIKESLLAAGVKNLKEFGYPDVTKENILTDEVYRVFFKSMLQDNIGKLNKQVDVVIDQLILSVSF